MYDDSSDARNSIAQATSSTSPGRRIGMNRIRSARTAGSAVRPEVRIGGITPASVTIACYSCDGSGPILQLETPIDPHLNLCFPAAPFAIGCWYGCPTPGIENGQCPNQTP